MVLSCTNLLFIIAVRNDIRHNISPVYSKPDNGHIGVSNYEIILSLN